jgi:PAS domain S-box-containing protein
MDLNATSHEDLATRSGAPHQARIAPTSAPDRQQPHFPAASPVLPATMTEVGERWTIRFVRAAAIVMLLMEAAYLAIDLIRFGQKTPMVVALHLLLIIDIAAFIFLFGASALARFRRQLMLAAACLIFALTAMLARSTGQTEPIVLTVTICVFGAAALVPWDARWQIALTVAGAIAIAAGPPQHIYHWLLPITALGVAFCATLLGERNRAERDARIDAIMRSHRAHAAEIAEREHVVDKREQALARLSQNESMLRQVFEASLDTIAISRLSDGRFIECNRSFLAISGYTHGEAIGRSAEELGIWANRGELREYMRRLRTDGRVPDMEMTLRNKDGRLIPHLATAVVARIGEEPCIITIGHEITELKRTEGELRGAREELSRQVAALRETESRLRQEINDREAAQALLQESEMTLRNVFDASVDAIALTDFGSGRLMRMNRSFTEITGYGPDEALGRTPSELNVWADRDQWREFVQLLLRDGEVRDFEGLLRHRDGRVTLYLMSAAVADVNDELRVITIAHDISERKLAERELIAAREAALAASNAKSEFLSSMSHEIRTPMNAILGMAELLSETPLNDEQRRYLETMRNNGDALLDLINDVLDLAKIESGRVNLERAPFDPGETVEKVLEMLALRAHEKGLELIGRIAPHVRALVIGDALRLRQVMVNLAGNAIKFTARGEVEVTAGPAAENSPGLWRFRVRDTGIGIAPAQLDAIFSAFTQGDSSTARRFGGSGLGLAIVKRLVELMGGAISVTSTPGEGSEFVCDIPFELDESAISGTPAGPRPLCGGRWLAADDHPRERLALAALIADCGAETADSAATGAALEAVSRAAAANAPYAGVVFGRAPRAGDSRALSEFIREIRALGAGAPGIVAALATDSMRADLAELERIGIGPERRCAWVVKPAKRREFEIALACAAGRAIAPPGRGVQGASAVPQMDMDAERTANPRPLKILLADDSSDNRVLVRAFLKALPYEIDVAENGAAAIEAVKRANYDLLLMDLQMPVVDGIEATRAIRAWERETGRQRTPIIALTASALDEAVRRSRAAGCDGHVSKPAKRATLIAAIAAAGSGVCAKASPGTAGDGHLGAAMEQGKRTIVEIDADLRDLAPAFIDHKRADAARLRSAIEGADFAAIAAIAHKIKGEGGSYGFDELTRIGAALEAAALNGGIEDARREISRLADYLGSVEIVFR